ncbi:MAG: hypothetical protein GY765_38610 [bacterium]|nr:hypothetical protein [bacterium]
MAHRFPKYPYGDSVIGTIEEDPFERLGSFGEIIDGAQQKGVIPFAPPDSLSAKDADIHEIRNRTVATRLWLLGYLKTKPDEDAASREIYTESFIQAVTRFQQDTGLADNERGWVGDSTWYALDALVGFESDTNVNQWYGDDKPMPSLERAIQLRLFSLGLYDSKPEPGFKGLKAKALDDFCRINFMFKLAGDGSLPWSPHPDTVTALFDQDNIVEKIADTASTEPGESQGFFYDRPQTYDVKKTNALANRFIINVAKIELWLIGFDVPIDGKDDYTITGHSAALKNLTLFEALGKYWHRLEGNRKLSGIDKARRVTPEFFKSLHGVHVHARDMDASSIDDDYSLEVAKDKRLNSDKKIKKAWTAVRKRSVGLWDGLKRVWRWIKKKVVKIISFFKKNIFRAFFRYATKAYKIVRTAVDSVVSSVKYYVNGVLEGSSVSNAVILHDADFDQTVFVNQDADPGKVEALGHSLEVRAAKFQLGLKIIGILLDTFRFGVTGLLGWARLLTSLVRNLKELKPLYRRLKELNVS